MKDNNEKTKNKKKPFVGVKCTHEDAETGILWHQDEWEIHINCEECKGSNNYYFGEDIAVTIEWYESEKVCEVCSCREDECSCFVCQHCGAQDEDVYETICYHCGSDE